ncbi:hypothetical protein [Oerskovia flava]|nr:hypothetical protein [Oerskovia sp. JB1-3-2]
MNAPVLLDEPLVARSSASATTRPRIAHIGGTPEFLAAGAVRLPHL